MKRNEAKVSVSTVFLVLAILVIIVMGYFMYKLNIEKNDSINQAKTLDTKIGELESSLKNLQETKETEDEGKTELSNLEYIENFNNSITKELGKDNMIYIPLSKFDYENGTGYLSVNNKNEAYIYLDTIEGYNDASSTKKIADNVVNAWYCEEGQVPGNNFIVFLKKDGTVTYVRFRTDSGKTIFEANEKVITGVENITNIIKIEGGDENGIGGYGVLFVKADGTCLPYSSLENMTK